MPDSILCVDNVQRSLALGSHQLHVLKGVTFDIAPGEWIALTGPSGSGKSTLLGVLGGIDRPTQGRVILDDVEISALPENRLARLRNEKIGIVFQSFHLIPSMTAQENVEVPLYVGPRGRQASDLARQMLELVGLGERLRHLPRQLSGGEQQRVAIARALVTQPRLLLADEPTGNLDTATGKQILTLLTDLRRQLNLTIVMVTHDAAVAAYADRRLHLVDGLLCAPEASKVMMQ